MNNPPVPSSRQPSLTTELIRCVVLEAGSLPLTDSDAEGFDQTIVIAQMQGELPALFAQRTLERLASVERSGRRLEAATLLTGDRHDPASSAARRLIAMGLSASARAHGPGHVAKLTLYAPPKFCSQQCAELLGLAEEVTALGQGEHVPVRVRFDEESPAPSRRRSGFFPAPRAPTSREQSLRRKA